VSTTQLVSGSVMGAGATRRFSAVRWGVARRIVWAWIFTIPASAILAAVAALLVEAGPVPLTFAVLVMGGVAFYLLVRQRRRKQPGDDFATASADGLIVRESTSQNHASERVSAMRAGKTQ
jgi:Flp pilus assembly protein TadB